MKRLIPLLFIALLAVSCGSKNSPTGNTNTFTWNGPLILSEIESGLAFSAIANTTGPVINAAVTVSYPGGSAVLPYAGFNSSYPVTYSGSSVTVMSCAYYYATSFTYTANQPYTMTNVFGGATYSAWTTAVGTPVFSTSGANLVCTWAGGGNLSTITAEESISPYTFKYFGPGVSSPYTLTPAQLPGPSGDNDVIAAIVSLNTSAFTGTSNGSYLMSGSGASTIF